MFEKFKGQPLFSSAAYVLKSLLIISEMYRLLHDNLIINFNSVCIRHQGKEKNSPLKVIDWPHLSVEEAISSLTYRLIYFSKNVLLFENCNANFLHEAHALDEMIYFG